MKIKNLHIIALLCVALVVVVCVLVYVVVAGDDDRDTSSVSTPVTTTNNANTSTSSATQQEYDYCLVYDTCGHDFRAYLNREDAEQVIAKFEFHPSDCWRPQWVGCVNKGELTEKMKDNQLEYCFAEIYNTDTGEAYRRVYTGALASSGSSTQRFYQITREEVEQYIEDYDGQLADNEEIKITCVQDL